MRSVRLSIACVALFYALTQSASAGRPETSVPAEHHPNLVLTSSSSAASFKSAPGDTFFLYGGPGSVLGKFQTALPNGNPDWQGWTAYDPTDQLPSWQLSNFHSPTSTQAMWAGRDASQEPGWSTAPGYGNFLDAWLVYRKPVTNPALGQTVGLSFVFHHDVEPDYDYFLVEYDAAGVTHTVLTRTGSTGASPLNFPTDITIEQPIVYAGNDYGPDNEITIRLRVSSDCCWSDEDGLYDSNGAAQVDNISVSSSEGVDFEDFEGSAPFLWQPVKAPFAGLFAQIFARVADLDPCRENETPVLGFIDDGTPASNPGGVLWTGEPIPSLGTTSPTWNYGVSGGWVVNYNGGLSAGSLQLSNDVWSPEFDWDQPGVDDDGSDVAGAFLRFDVYEHLPLLNGIFFTWHVRGQANGTGVWDDWRDRGFLYYGLSTEWANRQVEVSDLLPIDRDRIQVKLGVHDLALNFGFPGNDATVAPLFDNVSFAKYRIAGPIIVARDVELFGDSFASSGLADVSTQAARDLLDCRIDMNLSIGTAYSWSDGIIRSGDSLVVRVQSRIPGVGIGDPANQIRLHYSLNLNPTFEAALRGNAPVTATGGGLHGWDQHEGVLSAAQVTTSSGAVVADAYWFDLPDENFLYPGDILEYSIEAVDDAGGTTTLPADLSGFDDGLWGAPYDRMFQIRGLPTYQDVDGSQPAVLLWNDAPHRGGDAAIHGALRQLGLREGDFYDTYETRAAASTVDNGLGSASPNGRGHGATPAQLAGYTILLYDGGNLRTALINDFDGGSPADRSNDLALLRDWFDAAVDRYIAHFGDNLADYLDETSSQLQYVTEVMGVQRFGGDVRPSIGGQTAPAVVPMTLGFDAEFVAYGGCLVINDFDRIGPLTGAAAGHGFTIAGGGIYSSTDRAASVVWDRMVDSQRKVSVTFPYSMNYVYPVSTPPPSGRAGLKGLLENLFAFFDHDIPPFPDPTATDLQPRQLLLRAASPNPFNPRTTLHFVLGREASGDIEIFDVRGRSVRALARNADFPAGENLLVWDGRDEAGAELASGIYLVRYRIDGFTRQQKVALVR